MELCLILSLSVAALAYGIANLLRQLAMTQTLVIVPLGGYAAAVSNIKIFLEISMKLVFAGSMCLPLKNFTQLKTPNVITAHKRIKKLMEQTPACLFIYTPFWRISQVLDNRLWKRGIQGDFRRLF